MFMLNYNIQIIDVCKMLVNWCIIAGVGPLQGRYSLLRVLISSI